MRYAGINILVLRRTFPELEQNHLKEFRTLLYGIADYNTQRREFNFPNGSKIKFGYCNTEADCDQYQGQNIEAIFMDEATHFTEYMYMKFNECLRLSGNVAESENLKPRMYLTANPGGVGHQWVKRLFIDRQYRGREKADNYSFIPAMVYDNEFLMKNDPDYLEMLESLPEKEKQAMLYGDWNVFEGQFFEEFDEEIHTFDDSKFVFPNNYTLFRARDYGLDRLYVIWACLDEDDTLWVYRAYGESGLRVSESGKKINSMTPNGEEIRLDICPPDMWNKSSQTGKSAVDILVKECEQYPTRANNDRENGWLMVKERLMMDRNLGHPRLMIGKSCDELISSMKLIQHDEKKVNDCAKEPHNLTHSVDSLRYLCTSYTFAPERIIKANKIGFSFDRFALEMDEYEKKDYEEDSYIDMGNGGWFL